MNREAIKEFMIVNGELEKVSDTEIFNKIIIPPIYEVIRIIDSIPIFLEEHIERLKESVKLTNYTLNRTDNEIKSDIKKLIKINNVKNLNLKLLCTEVEGIGNVFLIYFIESYYPESDLYKKGIDTVLFYYERESPNIKMVDNNFKEKAKKCLDKTKAFEAILVNKVGYITEGSKSNVFFVKKGDIYTPPGKDVLLGITREKILKVCNEYYINVIEENIHIEDLEYIDGGFITGTSINVLPINTIDNKKLNSVNNNIITKVSEGYLKKIENYLLTKY